MNNGGFEEYYSCPITNDLNNGQLELAKGWWKPTLGTSDYFNRCNLTPVGIPNNFWGFQESFEGDGYVGLGPAYAIISTNEYYGFEYVQTKLLQKLKSCTNYHFEMYVSLSNLSRYSNTKLGALFTSDSMSLPTWNSISITPQVFNQNIALNDTLNWMKVQGDFEANGTEQYLSIGYFFDNLQNDTLFFQNTLSFPDETASYYYIDYVKLYELSVVENCNLIIPNFFTPNGDNENDSWLVNLPSNGVLEVYNRWGNSVFKNEGNSFSWDGLSCVEGVYFYKIIYTDEIKTGFIQLIR